MRSLLMTFLFAGIAIAETPDAQWVERTYSTSTLPGPDTLETRSLQLDGASATLVFEERKHPKRGEWQATKVVTQTGTRTVKNGVTTLRFEELTLTCTKKTLQVAPAGALRVPLPPLEEDCPRHRWKTARKVEVAALVCKTPEKTTFTFAAPPGLERLVVEADDCGPRDLMFAPLRQVPADGGVLPGH